MIKRLIHYGCSFAIGNAVPHFVPGLPGDVAPHIHKMGKEIRELAEKYKFVPHEPITCGKFLADELKLEYRRFAENGASNEMIFRKVLETKLEDSFVLIGFTSYNRREALTTRRKPLHIDGYKPKEREGFAARKYRNTHWHTWKMIGPGEEAKFKDIVFDPWKGEYTPAIEHELQIRTVMQIIYMQNYLKNNNIPYLMFNALWNGFDEPLTEECEKLLRQVDENYYYKLKGDFACSQHGWCMKEGLSVSEFDEHPTIEGHKQWSLQLLPLVEEILNAS
jgi:hypothetical protein|tara:strand:- start:898 stop:1731 length:834 start_codon:yes stop_codon:yes gene_type:complete